MHARMTLGLAFAASLALAGCGGGDDDNGVLTPPVTPPVVITAVPDSVITSSTSFVSYLNGQSFTDETSEALTLPAGDPSTSETEEPIAIT